MKNTILSEKDHQLLENTFLAYGRIVGISALMTIFTQEYSEDAAHNRINFLAKAGWLKRIKRGLYLVIDSLTSRAQTDISMLSIANALVEDSYVSLAHALNHYQMFDQYSTTIVSMSKKESKRYLFDNHTFKYVKVKSDLYFGFTEIGIDGQKVRVAEAEKALLDYLYVDNSFSTASLVFEKLRDHHRYLDIYKLQKYSLVFGATIIRKIGFLLDQLQLDSILLHEHVKQNRSFARFTIDSKLFNAKWRIYYDDRIIG